MKEMNKKNKKKEFPRKKRIRNQTHSTDNPRKCITAINRIVSSKMKNPNIIGLTSKYKTRSQSKN